MFVCLFGREEIRPVRWWWVSLGFTAERHFSTRFGGAHGENDAARLLDEDRAELGGTLCLERKTERERDREIERERREERK